MAGGAVVSGSGVGANAPKSKLAGILMVSFAAFGGILFGYDTGTISGITAMKDWLRLFGKPATDLVAHPTGYMITSSQQSLVTSILSAGTFFGKQIRILFSTRPCSHAFHFLGALFGSPLSDMFGRRGGIFVACLVFCFGVAMQTGCHTFPVFVVGRVFAGLGVGIVSTCIPMYLSECSPKWIRGAVVSGYQWAITIGLLLASVVNNATQHRDDHSAWRIPTAIQLVWAFVLSAGMLYLPEVSFFRF